MKELVGRKVYGLELDADRQYYIRFKTDQGDLCYFADGDCCSESWFADIIGVQHLVYRNSDNSNTVTEVRELELPAIQDGRSRQDHDQWYGYRIKNYPSGETDIVFRNSSNGFYGGNLNVVDSIPEGVRMMPVTQDYPEFPLGDK